MKSFAISLILLLSVCGTFAQFRGHRSTARLALISAQPEEEVPSYTDPTSIADLIGYYEADDLAYTDGDNKVEDWADKSSAGNNLIDDAGRIPGFTNTIASINNHAAVSFRNVDALYGAFGQTFTQPITIFAVWRSWSWGTDAIVSSTNQSGNDLALRINSSQQIIARGGSSSITDPTATPSDTWRLVTAQFNGGSSFIRTNGVQAVAGTVGSETMNGIALGGNEDNWFLNGEIAAVAIYTNTLSTPDIVNNENFFSNRFQFFTW